MDNQSYIEGINGKKYPIAKNLKNQSGLKREIIDLCLNLSTPDDDCMLSDFLYALQCVLDKHNLRSEANLMHPKVLNFAREMQKQININTELGKTTWETWANIKEILVDFEYHKAKAIMALKEDNMGALQEYIADCGNILMFLGNACGMYSSFEDSKPVFQMVSPLFVETTIEKAVLKTNINNL